MGKIAFVFPGQGAQRPGMGRELFEGSPAAERVFNRAEELRPGTLRQCFEGTDAELAETENTQPCMFAVELAAAAALTARGLRADMAAGFSLGEIAALVFAGAADLDTGFGLVRERGRLMQAASEKAETGMAAVLRLEDAEVERICAGFERVYPVNYNCPGQVAAAGAKDELPAFMKAVKEAGGRAVPLKVRGAFHSPFMAEAAAGFAAALESREIKAPELTLYSDHTGKPYEGDMKRLLSSQICSPVRWKDIVSDMVKNGADTFIELGPGGVLCGLIGKTEPTASCFCVEDMESLEKTLAEVKKC